MFATRKMPLEVELLKWMVIILLALAIAAIMAVQTAGGDELAPGVEPMRLPPDMGNVAKALAEPPAKPFFPENEPPMVTVDPRLADELWGLLRLQKVGKVEETLIGWKKIILPPTGEAWRHIALAIAELQAGNLPRAEVELDTSREYAPRHPLVAYYRGILRLEQAGERGVLDADRTEVIRLVAHRHDRVTPATRGMYQLAAIVEFQDALAWAEEVNLADPLMNVAGRKGPTVGDFLITVGAVNYVGQTHNMLAALYLYRGMLLEAEEHFDHAAATGIEIPYGYRDLGQAFEEANQNGDAVRAYLKAMTHHGTGWVRPGANIIQDLRKYFTW